MISKTIIWRQLLEHAKELANVRLCDLFAKEKDRHHRYTLSLDNLLLDYSQNIFTDKTLSLLAKLTETAKFYEAREDFFSGKQVNNSEAKAALHVAIRDDGQGPGAAADVRERARSQSTKANEVSSAIRNRRQTGFSGEPFSEIVNIGVGGSRLGVELACAALKPFAKEDIKAHFLSTPDRKSINALFATLNPEKALFIITSKSFETKETLIIAKRARSFINDYFGNQNAWKKHFLAITARSERAASFGVPESSILEIWDTIGGRFSIWSSAALTAIIQIGDKRYEQMLEGARAVDKHFAAAPLLENAPVVLALIGIFNSNFLRLPGQAILVYEPALALFPSFLQQLHMESNGKGVNRDGETIDYATSPTVWGGEGIAAQHSYGQALHQGTIATPVDFICSVRQQEDNRANAFLVANCLAQSTALMQGNSNPAPERKNPGNRPSNTIMIKKLTPETLGALIALYEHKIFTQSVIWQINPFDQWGVKPSKELATLILERINGTSGAECAGLNENLIKKYHDWSR